MQLSLLCPHPPPGRVGHNSDRCITCTLPVHILLGFNHESSKQLHMEVIQMVFMGHGFTSGGQKSGSVFSAAVTKYRLIKCYIESLPLVTKDKRGCFSQGERVSRTAAS